jgi:hypothetical protein
MIDKYVRLQNDFARSLSPATDRPVWGDSGDAATAPAKHKVATPVNWKNGEDVIIAGSVSDDDAKKQYPQGWKAPKPYLRIVPQPKG